MSFLPPHTILIYSDGACSGNPGPGGWGALVLTPDQQVQELGGSEASSTNNRMEMMAALKALELVQDLHFPIFLYTDSTYLIRGITQWVHGWHRNGWQSSQGAPIVNQDLWQKLYRMVQSRSSKGKIDWRFVRGHQGIDGNERCDQIAVDMSQGSTPHLYQGSLSSYHLDLLSLPQAQPLPEFKTHLSSEKKVAFSYLSYVNGVITRHASWVDCERTVKGQPHAKFKKANSPNDEIAIIKSWGLDPSQLKS